MRKKIISWEIWREYILIFGPGSSDGIATD